MWMLRYHARIQEFLLGWGGGGVQAGLPENSSDNVFLFFFSSHLILEFYRGCLMVISKEIFQGFRGSSTFSRGGGGGSNFFQGRGVGSNMLISI